MPLRDDTNETFGTALSTANIPDPTGLPGGSIGPTVRAAFELENDVLAVWDLATRPYYKRDPNFDNYAATKGSRYWDDYRTNFLGVESQEQWDAVAARIDREEKQRELLMASGPGTAVAATLAAGMASPTMLLPALTPLRGLKGIAAAAALGGLGAGLQELPLQAAQETRTIEDSITNLAAGTILGGVLGGAAQAVGLPKVIGQVYDDIARQFENDMARIRGTKAIPESTAARTLEAPPALIARVAPEAEIASKIAVALPAPAPVQVIRRADLLQRFSDQTGAYDMPAGTRFIATQVQDALNNNVPVKLYTDGKEIDITQVKNGGLFDESGQRWGSVSILQPAPGDDARLVIGARGPEDVVVAQDGPLIRAPSASPANDTQFETPRAQSAGSAAVSNPDAGGFAPGPFGKDISWLGKISPVVQTIAQDTFKAARRTMAKLSTAGLRLEGNADFIPARAGGTVEANVGLYDAFIAKLVKVVDEQYVDYVYQGATKPAFPATRAALRSTFRFTGKKLTREQFNAEISRAMFTGDEHPISQVAAAAKLLRSEIYDPILEKAKAVGLFEEGDLFDDASYLARMYDKNKIDANPEVFVRKLTAHFEGLLQDEVARASDRLKAQKKILDEYLDDVNLDAETAAARRADFQAKLDALEETDDEAKLTALRRERRELRGKRNLSYPERKANEARLAEIKAEIQTFEKGLGSRLDEKRGLRRRLRNLNRAFVTVEERRQKKLDRVLRTEEDTIASLRSVLTKGKQLQRDLDKLEPKQLRKQIDRLVERYYNLEEVLDRRTKQLADADVEVLGRPVMDGEGGWSLYEVKEKEAIDDIFQRMRTLSSRMEDIDDLIRNRPVLEDLLESLALESQEGVAKLALARGKRIARLEQSLEKLTPETVAERIAARTEKFRVREAAVRERLRIKGVDDFDFETGNASVSAVARARAEDAVHKIGKYNNRVSGLHVLGEERGSELARVLSIPSIDIFDYLVTDIERVTRNYIRQVAADIELKRAFGDVDAKMAFKEMEEEFFQVQARLKESGASQREIDAVSKDYRNHVHNITASISRLRHTWGLPESPDGFAARAAKVMLDLSTLRFMGSVAISSIPDMGRLVVKHGYKRVFGDAFGALIKDFKTFQLSAQELKLAGGALDPIIHSRAMAYADILDEFTGRTMPERIIHTTANKIGVIAAFDYWTSAMKQLAGVLDVAKMMDSIDLVVNGGGKLDEIEKATIYLADNGFNEDLARTVWDEVQKGGGGKVNGLWLPNTESWKDPEVVRAFRAAIRQANDNTIITPGLEVPLMANASMAMRLLFQFKSFTLSSHTKVLMAGLQQKDMALLNGIGLSLALGAFSYYTWAVTVGGDAYDEMQNAGLDKWFDEAWARAGLTGAFSEVQRIAERLPLTAPYANLSGDRTTNRAGSSFIEALLGPSFDTATTVAGVLTGLDDPTQATMHQFFNLLPLNNVFYLRRLFDIVEEELSTNLPERREK